MTGPLSFDDRLETAHSVLGVALSMLGRSEDADVAIETALALNQNSAFGWHAAGLTQMPRPRPDWRAMIAHGEAALQLSPMDPTAHAFQNIITQEHLIGKMDHFDPDFIASARAAARLRGAPWYLHVLAATAEIASENEAAARHEISLALQLAPSLTMQSYRKAFWFAYAPEWLALGDANGINQRLVELGLVDDAS